MVRFLDLQPAKWIWLPSERTLPCTFVLFRRTFWIDTIFDVSEAWIAADSRYLLNINGQRVQWGPAPHDPRHAEVDPVDLTPWLKEGENVIAVQVLYYGHPEGTWPFGKPGLNFRGSVSGQDISSGPDWKCSLDRSHQPGGAPRWYLRALQEVKDFRKEDTEWTKPGFDDSSWLTPKVLDTPANKSAAAGWYGDYKGDWYLSNLGESSLTARSIPLTREEFMDCGSPAAVHDLVWSLPPEDWFDFRTPGSFTIKPSSPLKESFELSPGVSFALRYDLPKEVIGFPIVEVTAPAGTVVEVIVQESFDPNGNGWLENHFYQWSRFICAEGVNHFEAFDYEAMRHLQVHVRGDSGSATINRVAVRKREYAWPHEPSFQVSDPGLQRLFEANVQTLINSCIDICVDGMGRERQQYSGDCGHQHHFVRLAFGAPELSRRFLKVYAQGQMMNGVFSDSWPAADRLQRLWQKQMGVSTWGSLIDHSIGFVFDHYNHWMETGDLEIVSENWPRLKNFLQFLETSAGDGLLDAISTGMNAVWIDHEAFRNQGEKQLSYNLYAAAMLLHAFGPLAEAIGDTEGLERARTLGNTLTANCQARFQNQDGEWFNSPDGRIDDRALSTALMFDIGSPDPRAASYLSTRPEEMGQSYPCNLPWNYWALISQGDVQACLDDLRERWVDLPSVTLNGTIQEMWDIALGSVHLLSHCSVAPLVVLYHGILGLRPLTPGFESYELRPRLGDLEWAEITAILPQGALMVKFTPAEIAVTAPPNCEGVLVVGDVRWPLKGGLSRSYPVDLP